MLLGQLLVLAMPVLAVLGCIVGVQENAPPIAYVIGALGYVALFPATFVLVAASNYVNATILHLWLKVLGAKGNYQCTLRIVAYSAGAGVWGLVPFVGGILQCATHIYAHYQGYVSLHGLSKNRAIVAIVAPMVVMTALMIGAIAAAVACDPQITQKIGRC
jgi:hypothetical protein